MEFTRIVEYVRPSYGKLECLIDGERDCMLGGSLKFQLGLPSQAIHQFNAKFVKALEKAKQLSTHSITLSRGDSEKILMDLYNYGLACYGLLGEQFGSYWTKYASQSSEIKFVVTSDTYPLLWELLYTGKSMMDVPDANYFFGMNHRIVRRLPGVDYNVERDPPIGFLFNQHERLKHVKQELHYIKDLCTDRLIFEVIDERLDQQSEPDSSHSLENRVILAWTAEDYSFIHVASHLRHRDDIRSALNLYIEISYGNGLVGLPIDKLAAASSDHKFKQYPLVFLNSCKSVGNEYLLDSTSFPKVLMRLGASAVIATVCDVPDLFAMKFAQKFYSFLFADNGPASMTPGQALLAARRYFLLEHNNPLGFAYVLYSSEDFPIRWV